MISGQKKLNTQTSINRSSLPKNIIINRAINNRSISVNHKNPYLQSYAKDNNQQKANPKYIFYLGKGNNQQLVRKIMKQRTMWMQTTDSTSTFVNFKWQQDQKGYKYTRLIDTQLYRSVLNHFQFHQCLSNKQYLFKNLQLYCQKTGDDIWKIVPPTFILNTKDQCSMQNLKYFLEYYQKYYPKRLKQIKPDYDKQISQQKKKLKNYFYNSNDKKNHNKLPTMNQYYINQDQGQYLWIVKPTFLNRGRGIQVFSQLSQLYNFITDNIKGYIQKPLIEIKQQKHHFVDYIKRNSQQIKLINKLDINQIRNKKKIYMETKDNSQIFDGNQYIRVIPRVPSLIKTDCFLIQKYLERPMLIKNHKFDIRIWVLVTHNLTFYVFKQGYIRLSSLEYTCKQTNNTSIHLTNNAIQKFTNQYGKISQGNQMSFKQLQKQMQQLQLDYNNCISIIHSHIQKSLAATYNKLNPLNRRFIFQIYGYDFMIDSSGYPWLIQVNNNPCIEQSSQLLSKLLHRMLDDAFKLTLDVLFPGTVSNNKHPVEGYKDNENMWKMLRIDHKDS